VQFLIYALVFQNVDQESGSRLADDAIPILLHAYDGPVIRIGPVIERLLEGANLVSGRPWAGP